MFATRRSEDCLRSMSNDIWNNETFVEFSCLYPSLEPFYMEWEKDSASIFHGYKFMLDHPYTPLVAILLYGIAIFAGKMYMSHRKPFQWRRAMALWNLFLCVYSFVAMIRMLPPLLHNLSSAPLRDNLCMNPELAYGRGSSGFWGQSFVWSKFVELIDTFFIIIHKKPLIFLHWYHHITVLLYTWDGYVSKAPAGPIFMSMNCAVHFIMYGYYFLMTIKMKPKWMNAMFITISQIAQMVVGVTTTIVSFYYLITHKSDVDDYDDQQQGSCEIKNSNIVSAFLMYGSYLFLFVQFFVNRYFFGNEKAGFAGKKVD